MSNEPIDVLANRCGISRRSPFEVLAGFYKGGGRVMTLDTDPPIQILPLFNEHLAELCAFVQSERDSVQLMEGLATSMTVAIGTLR